MSSILKRLNDCIENDERLSPLLDHWKIDKKILSAALQNVPRVYAHYSKHDSTHSEQLLVNIERMLGAGIAALSATD